MKGFAALNRLVLILNLFPSALLLLACFNAVFAIPGLSLLDAFGLLVPVLLILNTIFLVYWTVLKKKYLLISLLSLVTGFWCFGSIYQINTKSKVDTGRGIRLLTYNVQGFGSYLRKPLSDQVGEQILSFIHKQQPDIICFQEFSRIWARQLTAYPYRYQTPYYSHKSIQGIFSKYPIVGQGSLGFPNTGNNALYVDIVYQKDTLRIYNIHLESYHIDSFRSLLRRNAGLDFMKRLQATTSRHREQARILQEHRSNSPYPSIFCGDFNQTPYSPSFHLLLSGMRDTFKEKGKGWGTTFTRNIISARIDFILADAKAFNVLEHHNFTLRLSDHEPVMSRLELKSD